MRSRNKKSPTVTVVVVNWNGRKFISKSLEGLRNQVFGNFSVIVVDNGSEDGSVDFIKQNFPEVEVVELKENRGFCAANNIALERVRTKYAALLNNDASPDSRWLWELVNALEKNPEAGSAASKILCMDSPGIVDRAGDAYTAAGAGALRGRGQPSESFRETEFVFGACAAAALYRMDMLRNVGLFDETFFLICEDVDLSFRAQLMGYKCVFEPKAIVYHMVSKSIERDSSTSVYFGHRNVEWVYIKNMPSGLVPFTIFFHLVYMAVSFLYFGFKGKTRPFLRAKSDAIKGLPKIWRERKRVQRYRTVKDSYIFGLFDMELFLPRLLARRAKKNGSH